MENEFIEDEFDAVVIGAGHAGCEAALACAGMRGAKPRSRLRERDKKRLLRQ